MRTLALLLFLAACQSPPPCSYVMPSGVVRANSPEDAFAVAWLGKVYSERVSHMLGVEPDPFLIHFDRSELGRNGVRYWHNRQGLIVRRRIELWADAWPGMPYAIVHEMVHWYARAPWDRLPMAVEEGLADFIACKLEPRWSAERLGQLEAALAAASPAEIESALATTREAWTITPPGKAHTLVYAVGYRVVERVGVDGLRALCERAKAQGLTSVPTEWL